MSRSQLVAEHLPLLRRYARALTGNQVSGDAYVGAMLEALLQDPSLLDERHGPKDGLFKLFTQIWNSVALNDREYRGRPSKQAHDCFLYCQGLYANLPSSVKSKMPDPPRNASKPNPLGVKGKLPTLPSVKLKLPKPPGR